MKFLNANEQYVELLDSDERKAHMESFVGINNNLLELKMSIEQSLLYVTPAQTNIQSDVRSTSSAHSWSIHISIERMRSHL